MSWASNMATHTRAFRAVPVVLSCAVLILPCGCDSGSRLSRGQLRRINLEKVRAYLRQVQSMRGQRQADEVRMYVPGVSRFLYDGASSIIAATAIWTDRPK